MLGIDIFSYRNHNLYCHDLGAIGIMTEEVISQLDGMKIKPVMEIEIQYKPYIILSLVTTHPPLYIGERLNTGKIFAITIAKK